ncbi:MAG: hypothetical protein ACRC4M_03140 [Mycoplasma sp.]
MKEYKIKESKLKQYLESMKQAKPGELDYKVRSTGDGVTIHFNLKNAKKNKFILDECERICTETYSESTTVGEQVCTQEDLKMILGAISKFETVLIKFENLVDIFKIAFSAQNNNSDTSLEKSDKTKRNQIPNKIIN